MPSPTIVEVTSARRRDDETYPAEPRPSIVDTRSKLLTYPESPRPCTVDTKSKLLTYPESPKP